MRHTWKVFARARQCFSQYVELSGRVVDLDRSRMTGVLNIWKRHRNWIFHRLLRGQDLVLSDFRAVAVDVEHADGHHDDIEGDGEPVEELSPGSAWPGYG